MFNACYGCGAYRADKTIEIDGPYAVCPECGHRHPFRRLPLLIVSGASGAGKSAVCQQLLGRLEGLVLLDSDLLWRPPFNAPENDYREFFETWLRMAKNISQSGRPVVLFGAGLGVPENLEPCVERRYFSRVDRLALVCDDEPLAARLRSRPAWRESGDAAYIEAHLAFNRWFKAQPGDMITLMDTTETSLAESSDQVREWMLQKTA
jgi:hypothetical protein